MNRSAARLLSSGLRVWIAFGLLSLAWGSSYLFIRLGLRQLTPLSLVALRLLVGTAVIVAVARLRHENLRLPRPVILTIAGIATVNTTAPFLLISWGELTVPSGLASVLNSTMPIFGVLLAGAVLRDEPLTLRRAGGVVLGFTGVLVLLSRDLAHGGMHWSAIAGQGAIVLSSLCYAGGAVMARRWLRDVPSLSLGTWVVAFAALQSLALSMVFSRPDLPSLNGTTVLAVLWLGILGSGFAYVLSFYILSQWGAGRYAMIAYMLPVVGLTLGALILGEDITWAIVFGSILVLLGIVLTSAAHSTSKHSTATAPSVQSEETLGTKPLRSSGLE